MTKIADALSGEGRGRRGSRLRWEDWVTRDLAGVGGMGGSGDKWLGQQ